jgi:hypothetical protein
MPVQTGHVWVFCQAPKAVEQPQNIFVSVLSCACISRPMTDSYLILLPLISYTGSFSAFNPNNQRQIINVRLFYHSRSPHAACLPPACRQAGQAGQAGSKVGIQVLSVRLQIPRSGGE